MVLPIFMNLAEIWNHLQVSLIYLNNESIPYNNKNNQTTWKIIINNLSKCFKQLLTDVISACIPMIELIINLLSFAQVIIPFAKFAWKI